MLEQSINNNLLAHFEGERTGFCQVGPKKWLLPAAYADHAEGYYNMPLKKDDIWIVTYPRSGNSSIKLCTTVIDDGESTNGNNVMHYLSYSNKKLSSLFSRVQ